MKKLFLTVFLLMAFLFPHLSLAVQKEEKAWKANLGAKVYADYHYRLRDSDVNQNFNAFDISRAYIYIDGFYKNFHGRIVPDITRIANSSATAPGDYLYRLKYAFLEVNDLVKNHHLILGQQPKPWVEFEETIWTYRFIRAVFLNIEGFEDSTDLGVGLKGKYRDWCEYALGLYNGEEYHSAEVSKHKDAAMRVTIAPLSDKGFKLSGYGRYGKQNTSTYRNRWIAMLSYQHPRFSLAGQYAWVKGNNLGRGFSIFGFAPLVSSGFWNKIRCLGRFDLYDPDDDISDNEHYRILAGLSWDVTKGITCALTDEIVNYNDSAKSITVQDTNYVRLNLELKF